MRVLVVLAVAFGPGCLMDNPDFVERLPAYGDCSQEQDACQEGMTCFEVGQRGFVCTPLDCDASTDCPQPDEPAVRARGVCAGDNLCMLDCTPLSGCMPQPNCTPCPQGLSCAPGCGLGMTPDTSTACIACPAGMQCLPLGGGNPAHRCAFVP